MAQTSIGSSGATCLVVKNGVQTGPYELQQLAGMVQAGMVDADDLAWVNGMSEWRPVRQVLGLPPPLPRMHSAAPLRTTASVTDDGMPNSYLWLAILAILGCAPLGVVALVYACLVPVKLRENDFAGAERCSRRVVEWSLGSLTIVLIGFVWFFLAALSSGGY